MTQIDAEVAAVEKCVDVGSTEQPVVDPVFTTGSDGANVCGLQYRADFVAGDGAMLMVLLGNHSFESLLTHPRNRQRRLPTRELRDQRRRAFESETMPHDRLNR